MEILFLKFEKYLAIPLEGNEKKSFLKLGMKLFCFRNLEKKCGHEIKK
jgi:hypothetical protein